MSFKVSKMIEVLMTKHAIAAGVVGLISLLLTTCGLISDSSPIVTTEDGQLQGRITYSRNGENFLAYLGIPYAEPPVNDLRYEPPIPLRRPWKGVKKVTSYPPFCLQFDALVLGRLYGAEDCLFLNVFTKDVTPEKKKPVMVYFHGGGFMSGASSMYRPDYIMDQDVVLVTINYRLGPLGFLNTGSDGLIRGNMGLKDQVAALKWVKKNIGKFGGNPNQVTIFGESAGAASVHYHILSPASQGLFHKAIAQSGAVTCPWAIMIKPEEITKSYVELTGCETKNSTAMVSCLKRVNAADLVSQQIHLMDPTNDFLMFVPSEEAVRTSDTFLTENPKKILESGKFPKIPLLLGVTSAEGGLRSARFEAMPELITDVEKNWTEIAPKLLCYREETLLHQKDVSDLIREYYFGNSKFTDNIHEFLKNFTKLNSDGLFYEPIHRAAKLHARSGAPVYLYYYDYDSVLLPSMYSLFRAVRPDDWLPSELRIASTIIVDWFKENVFGMSGPHELGATHADDLFQLWNMEGITGLGSGFDTDFSTKFVKMFTDFAADETSLEFDGVKWPPIQLPEEGSVTSSSKPLKYMLLNNKPRLIDEPFAVRMSFWESLRIRDSR